MSHETKKPADNQPGEKPEGKFHYNPVNMSGRKAGVSDENDEEHSGESAKSDCEEAKSEGRHERPKE